VLYAQGRKSIQMGKLNGIQKPKLGVQSVNYICAWVYVLNCFIPKQNLETIDVLYVL